MTELKYQHAFLKNDPPFKYSGELQAGLFKKWVHEVQDWIADRHLSEQQGIWVSGKYCTGKVYRFFEQEIHIRKRKYITWLFHGNVQLHFPGLIPDAAAWQIWHM
jgi:hypothetical protein